MLAEPLAWCHWVLLYRVWRLLMACSIALAFIACQVRIAYKLGRPDSCACQFTAFVVNNRLGWYITSSPRQSPECGLHSPARSCSSPRKQSKSRKHERTLKMAPVPSCPFFLRVLWYFNSKVQADIFTTPVVRSRMEHWETGMKPPEGSGLSAKWALDRLFNPSKRCFEKRSGRSIYSCGLKRTCWLRSTSPCEREKSPGMLFDVKILIF